MSKPISNPNEVLAHYADGPALLEAVLHELIESDLNLALTNDTWMIRQITHHIVDGDDIWKTCIKAALGNTQGLFSLQWYWDIPQTEWAESWIYTKRPIKSSLALFRANRHHIVELVKQTSNADEKSIRIIWPEKEEKRITVGEVLEMQVRHLDGHINDIKSIRQAHNR